MIGESWMSDLGHMVSRNRAKWLEGLVWPSLNAKLAAANLASGRALMP
jgi:hypothetical protein